MYQSKYENPLEFTHDLFQQSTNELLKIFQQINYGYIQMYLQKVKMIRTIATMDKEFLNALNNDLDLPNAKAVLSQQVKKMASIIRSKKFDKFQKIMGTINAEFNVLGIIYTNPLDNPEIKSLVDE
jgi:cysteinyl-tRNA synthetase